MGKFLLSHAGQSLDIVYGAHIAFDDDEGRTLLGEVTGQFRDNAGAWRLRVKHFDGSAWPVDPLVSEVDVLERSY